MDPSALSDEVERCRRKLAQLADESIRHGLMDVATGLLVAQSYLGPVLHDLEKRVALALDSDGEASQHFSADAQDP